MSENWTQGNMAQIGSGAEMSPAEMLRHRAQQAAYVLAEATRIRSDAELMAAVRAYVREERDRLGAFLDEL